MLTPDALVHIADDIVALYGELEMSLVEDMARRIARIGVTDTSAWEMEAYLQAGGVYEDAIKYIATSTGKVEGELRAAFENAGTRSLAFDDRVYRAAGLNPIPLNQSPAMLQILAAGLAKTGGTVKNLTKTTAVASQQLFIRTLDVAYMQVVSGGMSYIEAIRRGVKTVASEGAFVIYPTGHRDRVDVAMRRAVLTGINQTCGDLQLIRAEEMKCDLMEITAHTGARPSHAAWQGGLVSRSGRDGYLSYDDVGYGSAGGLKGCNCRHDWFPFVEGFSTPSYTPEQLQEMRDATVELDGEEIPMYKATEKQRAMERSIRKTKRELAALDAAGNATQNDALKTALRTDFNSTAVKLKRQEAKLHDFLSQTKLPPQNERTQVVGFGRSQAQKAVWAAKKVHG